MRNEKGIRIDFNSYQLIELASLYFSRGIVFFTAVIATCVGLDYLSFFSFIFFTTAQSKKLVYLNDFNVEIGIDYKTITLILSESGLTCIVKKGIRVTL